MQKLYVLVLLLGLTAITLSQDKPDTKAKGPFTHFCQKQFYSVSNGQVSCNWQDSFEAACSVTSPLDSIPKSAIIRGPETVGKCGDTNSDVVKVVHH